MECARLSDAELLPLIREEGESYREALRELERRHRDAVRAFAAVCAVDAEAAEELARNAWRRATTLREGVSVGAVRPHALCSVLRTTADWAGTAKRGELHDELVTWIQTYVSEGRGDSSADDFPRTSMAARAFGSLPDASQTVLWHYTVEYDGVARVDQLLGGGTEEVSVLERRARREFYNAYVRLHEEEIEHDECRRLRRTVLAYADQKSIETAAELTPHLEWCAHCSQAVDDLGLMRVHCGALLAEALLPWGGPEYAASSLPSSAAGALRGGNGAVSGARDGAADSGARSRSGAGAGGGERSYESRLTGRARSALAGWAGRLADLRTAALAGARGGEPRPGDGRRRYRTKRVMQSALVVTLSSLVVAVAYTGAFRPGAPQSSASPPARGASQTPLPPSGAKPTTATATATSTVTTTRTAPPPQNGGGQGGTGKPPAVVQPVNAALEWLFDTVNGTTAADTSANGIVGTLFGDPLPKAVAGALEFNGAQDVSADGSVLDTERSFSVSARVRLLDKGGPMTVVSQDGYDVSGFALRYDVNEDRWAMSMSEDDSQDVETDVALSRTSPRAGVWTRLTGVYDDSGDEIRLYVDGRLQDTVSHDGDWPAEGDFTVGRGLLDGGPFQQFRGTVDDVRAYDRALSGREVLGLGGA
ncbi:LamG domain-containing protein [Streptomyces marispadix]|uniref:LamG domain-containing protein n=1 Tax=Streptomyces marispadix TaxID=2922868 RepID=A0ABS9T0T5_9ACTN|nr:LamG domain-containing protein [Streptomyces marispadix]MCH6162134.1 LamG domain-containing protein [Streptomyces marispadix]